MAPGTYTLTVRSGAAAFHGLNGLALDGDNNGTAGGDFQTSVVFAAPAQVPSVDDFVRPVTAAPQKAGPNPRDIKAPDQVKVSQQQVTTSGGMTPVVKAASTQDAINAAQEAAITTNRKDIQ